MRNFKNIGDYVLEWKPKPWIAGVLGLFLTPLGMLYVHRWKLALLYFAVGILIGVTEYFLRHKGVLWTEVFSLHYLVMIACGVHAYWIAREAPKFSRRRWYSRWYGLAAIPVFPLLAIFSFRAFLYELFTLPSQSMFPTIRSGAHLIVKKYGYGNYGTYGISLLRIDIDADKRPKRGDIFVFEFPHDRSIKFAKRIIGIPGDGVAYKGKRLFINGVLVHRIFRFPLRTVRF